jgi:electron transport complex protein RnfG
MTTPDIPSYRQRVAYHASILGFMALFVSVAIVMGDLSTRDDIRLRKEEDMMASLRKVIPPTTYDNNPLADMAVISTADGKGTAHDVRIFIARLKKNIVAVAYQVTGTGYAGDIEIMMGVTPAGALTGVRIVSHAETPGLGDKIEERKSDWILKFAGLSLVNPIPALWKVKKDGGQFDQFSGATITPRGVVAAVRQGLEFFQQHKQEILTTPVAGGSANG